MKAFIFPDVLISTGRPSVGRLVFAWFRRYFTRNGSGAARRLEASRL